MKTIFLTVFLFCTSVILAQDSTYYKIFTIDNIEIQKEMQRLQDSVQVLNADLYRIEGAIGYMQMKKDTVNNDAQTLTETYKQVQTLIQQLQINLLKLQGYKEYNELLLQREKEKFKK